MSDWTDIDYAQAAIDMLPGSVDEIEEFLRDQKIKSVWQGGICPVNRWVEKWTDWHAYVGFSTLSTKLSGSTVQLPEPVREYILKVDRKS